MKIRYALLVLTASILTACAPATPPETGRLRVVVTTNILADVVAQVGGEFIQLTTLLPPGTDPHNFQPSPREITAVTDADLVFASGLGLEVFMQSLLENAKTSALVVEVSQGIQPLTAEDGSPDPHVWLDPTNVIVWAANIAAAFSVQDPARADLYAANASSYQEELRSLDSWAQAQVNNLSPGDRPLVTDHDSFGYFAARYGFEIIGAVIPGYSTLAEPSAQELARLEDAILELGIPVIFVSSTVNSVVAARIAEDTGTQILPIYSGSLSAVDGPAPTYLAMMRYNVAVIVEGLKE